MTDQPTKETTERDHDYGFAGNKIYENNKSEARKYLRTDAGSDWLIANFKRQSEQTMFGEKPTPKLIAAATEAICDAYAEHGQLCPLATPATTTPAPTRATTR